MRSFAIVVLVTGLVAWLLAGQPIVVRAWAAILLVALPAAAIAQARLLAREPDLHTLSAYASTIVSLILMAAITALVAGTSGLDAPALGLTLTGPLSTVVWTLVMTGAAVGVILAGRTFGLRETAVTLKLMPRTARERRTFMAVSIAAGTCEELAYRGFLLGVLWTVTGSAVFAVLTSAAAFGVVHGYQAIGGAARASLMGLILSVPVVMTGSIVPSMLAHTAIDLIAGLVLAEHWVQPDSGVEPG